MHSNPLTQPSLGDGLGTVGLLAQGSTIDEMARSLRAEFERWGPLDQARRLHCRQLNPGRAGLPPFRVAVVKGATPQPGCWR